MNGELLRGNIEGEIWLTRPNVFRQDLREGGRWGTCLDIKGDQTMRVEDFCYWLISKILAKTGIYKKVYKWAEKKV